MFKVVKVFQFSAFKLNPPKLLASQSCSEMEQSVIPFWSDGHSYNSSPIPGDVRDKVVELNLTSVIIIEIDRSPIGPG
ncbi:MAG: hypothetical protein ABIS36_18070, partial [Chryseolinea sp.]